MGKRYALTQDEYSKLIDISISITIAYLTRIDHPSNLLTEEWIKYKKSLVEFQRKMWHYFYK